MKPEPAPPIAPLNLPPQVTEPDKVAPASPVRHEPEAATPTVSNPAEEPPTDAPTTAPSVEPGLIEGATAPSSPHESDDERLIRGSETATKEYAATLGTVLADLLGALVNYLKERSIGEKDLAGVLAAESAFDHVDLRDLIKGLNDLADAWKRHAAKAAKAA